MGTAEYQKRTGSVFRDPDRQIRCLHQKGVLIKVSKVIYKYDPDFIEIKKLEGDGFRCVVCGRGLQDGIELQVDRIKPKRIGVANQ